MNTRVVIVFLIFSIIVLALIHFTNPLRAGAIFAKKGDLDAVMESKAFATMGSWGDRWPAAIVQVSRSPDQISFYTAKGQSTVYKDPGYVGYEFIHLRMKHETDGEFDLLYKTSQKR